MNWQIEWWPELASTQAWLKQHAIGLPEGRVVVAERQTAGYGRQERSWHSEPGGLYVSLLLRPPRVLANLPAAWLWALVEGLEQQLELPDLALKYPNDLVLKGHKLGGLLIDGVVQGQQPAYYLVGWGLNLNQTFFPPDLRATSLRLYSGQSWERESILMAVLTHFENIYRLLIEQPALFQQQFLQRLQKHALYISYNSQETISLKELLHHE